MDDMYIGTIVAWAPNFAPVGWLFCDGRLLPITEYTPLFALIGTTYGGNGTTNFALPNLCGRAPVGAGSGPGLTPRPLGQASGSETVVLGSDDMPVHGHSLPACSTTSDTGTPGPNRRLGLAQTTDRKALNLYTTNAADTNLQPTGTAGASHGHNNMQPFLALNYIICVQGIFPPRP